MASARFQPWKEETAEKIEQQLREDAAACVETLKPLNDEERRHLTNTYMAAAWRGRYEFLHRSYLRVCQALDEAYQAEEVA